MIPLSTSDLGFFFEPHHHALADHLQHVGETLLSEEDQDHDLAYARDVATRMGSEFGLYRFLMPATGEPDVRALCLIREALGFVSPLADSIFAVQGLGTFSVLVAGEEPGRTALLDEARSGSRIAAFGLTEPEAGTDVRSMTTAAVEVDGGWRLTGEKTFISNVGIADHVIIFAKTDDGFGAFVVPFDTPGLTTKTIPMSLDHPIGGITLTDCVVPSSARLPGDGFKLAMRTLDTFRVSVAGAAVGMARRALDCSVRRANARKQFGKPIAAQQTIQGYIADMATDLDAARLLTFRAAHLKDTTGERGTRSVSMAKLFATEAAQRIIDRAVQIHGGLGVTRGEVVERLYREIRPLRIYEGTTEIQRLIIAKSLLRD